MNEGKIYLQASEVWCEGLHYGHLSGRVITKGLHFFKLYENNV